MSMKIASGSRVISKQKDYSAMTEQIKGENPILELKLLRLKIAELQKKEKVVNEYLKNLAIKKGVKESGANSYTLSIGGLSFVRSSTMSTNINEDALRVVCKRKKYVYPEKEVVKIEFDEEAFVDLKFTREEREEFLASSETIRGYIKEAA